MPTYAELAALCALQRPRERLRALSSLHQRPFSSRGRGPGGDRQRVRQHRQDFGSVVSDRPREVFEALRTAATRGYGDVVEYFVDDTPLLGGVPQAFDLLLGSAAYGGNAGLVKLLLGKRISTEAVRTAFALAIDGDNFDAALTLYQTGRTGEIAGDLGVKYLALCGYGDLPFLRWLSDLPGVREAVLDDFARETAPPAGAVIESYRPQQAIVRRLVQCATIRDHLDILSWAGRYFELESLLRGRQLRFPQERHARAVHGVCRLLAGLHQPLPAAPRRVVALRGGRPRLLAGLRGRQSRRRPLARRPLRRRQSRGLDCGVPWQGAGCYSSISPSGARRGRSLRWSTS